MKKIRETIDIVYAAFGKSKVDLDFLGFKQYLKALDAMGDIDTKVDSYLISMNGSAGLIVPFVEN